MTLEVDVGGQVQHQGAHQGDAQRVRAVDEDADDAQGRHRARAKHLSRRITVLRQVRGEKDGDQGKGPSVSFTPP